MAFKKDEILSKLLYSENMLHDEMIGWTALLNYTVSSIDESLALYRQHAKNVKGIERKTFREMDYNTKKIIIESNKRFWKKYEDISNYAADATLEKVKANKAANFYRWKYELGNTCKMKGLYQIIENVIQGSYKSFTSKSDHALLKDLFISIS